MTNQLADPFARIFTDWAEANWAFDLLRDAVRRLRVTGQYDPRVAVTLSQRSGRDYLRLNFGGWLVLGFRSPGQSPERVELTLLGGLVAWDERFASSSFERKGSEPEVRSYDLPPGVIRPMTSDVRRAFETTLDFIAGKFQRWKKSTRWKHHNPEIIEACFDPERRAQLLATGLSDFELRYERHFTAFHLELAEGGYVGESGNDDWQIDDLAIQQNYDRSTDYEVMDMESDGDARFWKIAPGRNAWNWSACRDGGFVAIGWEELGDLSEMSREMFEARRDELIAKYDNWRKRGVNQVWEFAHIREGDRVIANRGTSEILGIGTVVGKYYFVPGVRHGHRLPVRWDDLKPRQINELSWVKTLIPLDQQKFETLCEAPLLKRDVRGLTEPFSWIFSDRDEAEWAFDFLKETLEQLSVTSLDDLRFAVTLTKSNRLLSLNFCNWKVLAFRSPTLSQNRISIPFVVDAVNLDTEYESFSFSQSDDEPDVREYRLPIDTARPFNDQLRRAYEKTFTHLSKRFEGYTVCPWRNRYHQPEIAEAIFDLEKRETLFTEGAFSELSTDEDLDEEFEIEDTPPNPTLSLADLAGQTGFSEEELGRWVRAIERKGQAILYGPPGTGKTYLAENLATHLIGGGDGIRELVQFHPAYAYEDFMQGIRPQSKGDYLTYPMLPGRFLDFCRRADRCSGRCVLIIDEINRANLARVFGELMYLLEYRSRSIPLAGDGTRFQIPANVRLIGAMNTADRSIALVDHALRRRFAFIRLDPNFEVLRRFHHTHSTGFPVEALIAVLETLNNQIDDPNYAVGITFFLDERLADHLPDIWQMEIEPYLEEYFFSQPAEVEPFRWEAIRQKLA